MVNIKLYAALIILSNLWACKHKQIKLVEGEVCNHKEETLSCENLADSPSFRLIDGDIVNYNDFPSVNILYNAHTKSFCTGTFIKANLMITAGHCLSSNQSKNSLALVEPKVIENTFTRFLIKSWSMDFKMNPKYLNTARLHGPASFQSFLLDVGFVVFPDNTSNVYRELKFEPINYGETIELVGFGKYGRRKKLDLKKRTGTNEIVEEIYHKDFIEIRQVIDYWKVDEEKGDTGILPGDSGGPMLHEDKIVGIVSGYSYKRRFIFWKKDIRGIFAELAWEGNKEFIKTTINQLGQKI